MRPDRLPPAVRLTAYAAATAVVLYICLAPTDALPDVALDVWDKAEHALTWAGLVFLGLAFWPRRLLAVSAFALVLGAAIEALQAGMGAGRQGDPLDFLADAVGVAAVVAAATLLRRRRGRARDHA